MEHANVNKQVPFFLLHLDQNFDQTSTFYGIGKVTGSVLTESFVRYFLEMFITYTMKFIYGCFKLLEK